MGRPSTVKRLPESVREALNGWLRDPGITQGEATERANALLAEIDPGHPPVSRKAVNRYAMGMREVGQKIIEQREIADQWIGRLGSKPAGQLGHLVVETIRTVAFECGQMMARGELTPESLPGTLDQVNKLALAAQRLSRSSAEEERRERQIREEARRQAAEEIAAKVEAEGGAAVAPARVRELAREIYGV